MSGILKCYEIRNFGIRSPLLYPTELQAHVETFPERRNSLKPSPASLQALSQSRARPYRPDLH